MSELKSILRDANPAEASDQFPVFAMDLHVHAGLERGERSLADFVSALHTRGVKYAGLLDHVELHMRLGNWGREHGDELRNRQLKAGTRWEAGTSGVVALYESFRAMHYPEGMLCRAGIEFNRNSLIAIPPPVEALMPADYISFCFGNLEDCPGETYGERAAHRIRQVGRLIAVTGKPGIVNHPFRNMLREYRLLLDSGAPVPPPEEFVTRDDVLRMIEAAEGCGLALEANQSDMNYDEHAHARQTRLLCVHALRIVVESGVPMSIGSDCHCPPGILSSSVKSIVEDIGLEYRHVEPLLKRIFPG